VILLAANALSIVSVLMAGAMVYIDHPGFAIAMLCLAFLGAHSVKGKDE
jgi:hypothetical protein